MKKGILIVVLFAFFFTPELFSQENSLKKNVYQIKIEGLKSAEDGKELELFLKERKGIIESKVDFKKKSITIKTEQYIDYESLKSALVRFYYPVEAFEYTVKEE